MIVARKLWSIKMHYRFYRGSGSKWERWQSRAPIQAHRRAGFRRFAPKVVQVLEKAALLNHQTTQRIWRARLMVYANGLRCETKKG